MARSIPLPDAEGYFGEFGGRYVPETLMAPLAELSRAYDRHRRRRAFRRQLAAVEPGGPGIALPAGPSVSGELWHGRDSSTR